LNAPATPLSDNTGEPMKINGPVKLPIEPDAMMISPLFAVVFLITPIEPLLCLII
jgi:hypothetical protein